MTPNQTNYNSGYVTAAFGGVLPVGYNGFNPAFLFGELFGLGLQWRFREFADAPGVYKIECEHESNSFGETVRGLVAVGFLVDMKAYEFRFPHSVSMDRWDRLQIQAGKCPKCSVVHWACCDPTTLIRLSEKRLLVVQQDDHRFQVRVEK